MNSPWMMFVPDFVITLTTPPVARPYSALPEVDWREVSETAICGMYIRDPPRRV